MPLALTSISDGTWAGSTQVTVLCTDVDGTDILLHRGGLQIGSGDLSDGQCVIAVSPLAAGDVIYASVTEKGNRVGIPAIVAPSEVRATGWKTPTELIVQTAEGETLTMPADLFEETYRYLPAPIFDPEGTSAIVFPEYEQPPVGGIGFDVLVNEKFEETLIFVQNIRGIKGSPLARFDGGSWSGTLSKTVTENTTVVIDVRGDDDTEFETREIAVVVASEPVTAFELSKHIDFGNNSVNIINGKEDSVQFRLEPFDMTWSAGFVYQPHETRKIYQPVPAGNYIAWVRFPGDTNPANWGKLEFTKPV